MCFGDTTRGLMGAQDKKGSAQAADSEPEVTY